MVQGVQWSTGCIRPARGPERTGIIAAKLQGSRVEKSRLGVGALSCVVGAREEILFGALTRPLLPSKGADGHPVVLNGRPLQPFRGKKACQRNSASIESTSR